MWPNLGYDSLDRLTSAIYGAALVNNETIRLRRGRKQNLKPQKSQLFVPAFQQTHIDADRDLQL